MPVSVGEGRKLIQFITDISMPSLIHKAAVKRGMSSNSDYLRNVVAEAVCADLGLDIEQVRATLPPAWGIAGMQVGVDQRKVAQQPVDYTVK